MNLLKKKIMQEIDIIHEKQQLFFIGYITAYQWLTNTNKIDELVKKLDRIDRAERIGLKIVDTVNNKYIEF